MYHHFLPAFLASTPSVPLHPRPRYKITLLGLYMVKVGDWLDARDNVGNWCVAQVVNIDGELLRVHFQGWNSSFDEDIRLESPKVIVLLCGPQLGRNILLFIQPLFSVSHPCHRRPLLNRTV